MKHPRVALALCLTGLLYLAVSLAQEKEQGKQTSAILEREQRNVNDNVNTFLRRHRRWLFEGEHFHMEPCNLCLQAVFVRFTSSLCLNEIGGHSTSA